MGGKWILVDKEFSGLLHFLKMKMEYQYIVEQAWNRYTEFHNDNQSVELATLTSGGAGSSLEGSPDKAEKAEAAPKAKAKGKAGGDKGKTTEDTKGKGDNKDKNLAEALAVATKAKNNYLRVVQKAEQLIKQIKADPSYDDLNNEQNLNHLEKLHASLQKSLCPFGNRFLLEDVKVLKDSYVQDQFIKLLQEFAKVDPRPLKDFTAKCLRRHQA